MTVINHIWMTGPYTIASRRRGQSVEVKHADGGRYTLEGPDALDWHKHYDDAQQRGKVDDFLYDMMNARGEFDPEDVS